MASIQGIYVALFGRPADPTGLSYFNTVTNGGADLSGIGDLSSQKEYMDRFVGMSSTQIVNSIYQSLFGHDGEASGVAFYVAKLAAGELTINTVAINILDGAQGADKALIDTKIAAADLFTSHLDLATEVNAYGPSGFFGGSFAIQVGREYLNLVTATHSTTSSEADTSILRLFPSGGQAPGGGGGGDGGGDQPVVHLPTATDTVGGHVSEADLSVAHGLVDGSHPAEGAAATTGNLTYSFGVDGAAAAAPFAWSTTVAASNADGTVPLTSDGDPIQWTVEEGSNGKVLIGTAVGTGDHAGDVVATLSLDDAETGAYTFTLLGPVDHTGVALSGENDQLHLSFAYSVKDATGDTAVAHLGVAILDDAPTLGNESVDVQIAPTKTNLVIALDISGSMQDPAGFGNFTKLQAAEQALQHLISGYDDTGDVLIRIVTFSDTATPNAGGWLTPAEAVALVANLHAVGQTNYDAALAGIETAATAPGAIADGKTVVYFLSDGNPTAPVNSTGINATEQTAWEDFLATHAIKSYAVGLGAAVATASLEPIAYDGVTTTQIPAIKVTDFSQLDATLTGTILKQLTGTAIGSIDVGGIGVPGADQPAHILSVATEGATYTYNAAQNAIVVQGNGHMLNFDVNTHVMSITTALANTFSIDFDTGSYTYDAQNGQLPQAAEHEDFTISIADSDGDTATAVLTIGLPMEPQPA